MKMKNLFPRSQAKNLLVRVEKFTNVTFDFVDVIFIGQAFVDEIFRVYVMKYSDITLLSIEMMVNRDITNKGITKNPVGSENIR